MPHFGGYCDLEFLLKCDFSEEHLSVDVEAEVESQFLGGGAAEDHSFEKDLEVVHYCAEGGVDLEREGDAFFIFADRETRLGDRVIDVVVDIVSVDELFISDSCSADVALVGDDERGGDGTDGYARTLVVISDGGDDLCDLLGVHSHSVKDTECEDRAALAMVDTVYEVADIVQIACDSCELGIALGVAERGQDISCGYCNARYVGKAMLGIPEGGE